MKKAFGYLPAFLAGAAVLVCLVMAVTTAQDQGRQATAHLAAIPTITVIQECQDEAVHAPCTVTWPDGHVIVYLQGPCPATIENMLVTCVQVKP